MLRLIMLATWERCGAAGGCHGASFWPQISRGKCSQRGLCLMLPVPVGLYPRRGLDSLPQTPGLLGSQGAGHCTIHAAAGIGRGAWP